MTIKYIWVIKITSEKHPKWKIVEENYNGRMA